MPPPKEEYWRVPDIVSLAVVRCGLPTAGGASHSGAVVRVAVADDGIVPRCHGGGVAVEVAADDDGVVPGRSGGGVVDGGAFEDPAKRRDIGMSPMESVARRPQ